MFPTYTTQDSTSSNDSVVTSTLLCDTNQSVDSTTTHSNRKATRTLETGRKSKYLVLVGDEAIKREKRRQKNREAAKRLKEKRQLMEEELNKKIHELENQHSNLQNFLQILHEKKQTLTYEVNNVLMNEIEQLLTDDNLDISLSSVKQYSNDFDFDEVIEQILNGDSNNSSNFFYS